MRPRHEQDDDDDDEWEDDREDPAEIDQDADDEPETAACPFCGKELIADADACPKCGNFVGGSDDRTTRAYPKWVILTALLVLAAMVAGLIRWL